MRIIIKVLINTLILQTRELNRADQIISFENLENELKNTLQTLDKVHSNSHILSLKCIIQNLIEYVASLKTSTKSELQKKRPPYELAASARASAPIAQQKLEDHTASLKKSSESDVGEIRPKLAAEETLEKLGFIHSNTNRRARKRIINKLAKLALGQTDGYSKQLPIDQYIKCLGILAADETDIKLLRNIMIPKFIELLFFDSRPEISKRVYAEVKKIIILEEPKLMRDVFSYGWVHLLTQTDSIEDKIKIFSNISENTAPSRFILAELSFKQKYPNLKMGSVFLNPPLAVEQNPVTSTTGEQEKSDSTSVSTVASTSPFAFFQPNHEQSSVSPVSSECNEKNATP